MLYYIYIYNDIENFIPPTDSDISEKCDFAPQKKRNVGIVHHHRNILTVCIYNCMHICMHVYIS